MRGQDYDMVASILLKWRPERRGNKRDMWDGLVDDLCVAFKRDNPNFNMKRFRNACGQG